MRHARWISFCLGSLIFCSIAWAGDSVVQPQSAAAVHENPVALTRLDQLNATTERPLFAFDRRAVAKPIAIFAAPPPALPPPPPEPPQIVLAGIIVDADGPRAIIRSEPNGKSMPVRPGDDVGGWKVTEIEGHYLIMSLDERSVSVKLFGHPGDRSELSPLPRHAIRRRVLEVNSAGVLRSHPMPIPAR